MWTARPDLRRWEELVNTRSAIPEREITIAMVGKYVDLTEAYKIVSTKRSPTARCRPRARR